MVNAKDRIISLFRSRARDHAVEEAPPNPTDYILEDCIGARFGMIYRSASLNVTKRDVTLQALVHNAAGDLVMKCRCHKRNTARNFRADRVRQLIHLGTGEIFADPEVFLAGLMGEDPVSTTLRRALPGIQVLAFLAWCDGEFHNRERAIIKEYARGFVKGPPGPTRSATTARIMEFVSVCAPDTRTFYTALDRFAAGSNKDLKALAATVCRVVDADGRLAPEEFSWLLEVEDTLGALSSE